MPLMQDRQRWVVWYLHWRYHSSRVEIREADSRDDAFRIAGFLEDEADDCVNEVIGIEDSAGRFIDLIEYEAAKPALQAVRDEQDAAMRAAEENQAQFRITITGPGEHVYTEVWSTKYLDKYRDGYLAQFGPGRVHVEPLTRKEQKQ